MRGDQSSGSSCAGSYGPSRLKSTSCCGVATVAIGSICRKPSRLTVSSTPRAEPSSSCARTAILRASSGATTRGSTALAMALDEVEDALPGVLGRVCELLLLAVEEAVRRALVADELVVDPRVGERLLEGRVVLGGDVLVGPGLQREDRRVDLSGPLGRPRAVALGGHAVEADRAGEAVAARCREPGLSPAHAETDREDGAAAELPQAPDRGPDIGLNALRRRLSHVLRVVEVLATLVGAGGPTEVVERERRVTALGEAQRQLLVEAVETADIGQDHDAGVRRLLRRGQERGEAVAVAGLQHDVLVRDGRTGDDRDRRQRVEVEA